MADEMDLCEYMWSHEMAMIRLLSWIRQSQSHCTDTECIDEMPAASGQLPADNFLLMSLFVIFAFTMYYLRPNNLRTLTDNKKPRGNDGNGNGNPPPTAT